MSPRYVYFDEDGRILFDSPVQIDGSAQAFIYAEVPDMVGRSYYVAGGALVEMGAQPPPYHAFDYAAKAWLVDVAGIRAAHQRAIEAERDRRTDAVIVYQGVNIDADARSQKIVSDKLAELVERDMLADPMPVELLVWRDADNVTHTFADQAAYRAWVGGLAIAMAYRGTLAYAWSWTKKAQLQALGDDFEALIAFDPTA